VRNLEIEEHLHAALAVHRIIVTAKLFRGGSKRNPLYFKAPADLQKRIQRSVRQAAKAEAPRVAVLVVLRVAAPLAAAALVVLMLVPFFGRPSSDELLTQDVSPAIFVR